MLFTGHPLLARAYRITHPAYPIGRGETSASSCQFVATDYKLDEYDREALTSSFNQRLGALLAHFNSDVPSYGVGDEHARHK